MSTDLTEKNLEGLPETPLYRDGGKILIRYGYNSGGYERFQYAITADGGTLSIDTVIAEISEVDFTDPDDPQWHVVAFDVNYEDPDLVDSHTGEQIPTAYEV